MHGSSRFARTRLWVRGVVWFGLLLAVLVLGVTVGQAQWGRRYGVPPRFPDPNPSDRSFVFSRILYQSVRSEAGGQGWYTDYPFSDANFMIRLSELTKASVSFDKYGEPQHVVVTLMDDELFDYPFVFMSDVGTAGFTTEEAARLRDYLLKGGFLWVDDFWGPRAWDYWVSELSRVLPPGDYPIFDIPMDHPIFYSLNTVTEVPQIPSIQHWRRSGGTTSERGYLSSDVHFRGVADEDGRLMIVMSHNTDIADGWEREGEDVEFFHRFSIDAYAVGFDVLIYAMSH